LEIFADRLLVYDPSAIQDLSTIIEENDNLIGLVSYSDSDLKLKSPSKPHLCHSSGKAAERSNSIQNLKFYKYPTANSPSFVIPGHHDFDYSAAALAHTRSLTFVKPLIGGPLFNLEAIWEEHTNFEFGDRSVAKTMATMVQDPYVNHIPTVRKLIDGNDK